MTAVMLFAPIRVTSSTIDEDKCSAATDASDNVNTAVYCTLAAEQYAIHANHELGSVAAVDLTYEAYDLYFAGVAREDFDKSTADAQYRSALRIIRQVNKRYPSSARLALQKSLEAAVNPPSSPVAAQSESTKGMACSEAQLDERSIITGQDNVLDLCIQALNEADAAELAEKNVDKSDAIKSYEVQYAKRVSLQLLTKDHPKALLIAQKAAEMIAAVYARHPENAGYSIQSDDMKQFAARISSTEVAP